MIKLGRNDKCSCGSGKKYKQCCMQKDASSAAEMTQIAQEITLAQSNAMAGRITEAEALCQQILQRSPHHPDALHLLGMIAQQRGNDELAADYVRNAIAANPSNPEYSHNLGVILKRLGRVDEAVENYRRALSFKNNWQDTLRHLTTPLVLTSGMDLSASGASRVAKDCNQTWTPPGDEAEQLSSQQDLCERNPICSEHAGGKKLRVVLLYPPPWKIYPYGNAPTGMPFGAPKEPIGQTWSDDFQSITYGLLTIAAQARRAGHTVSLYNIVTCNWPNVVKLITETEADVYGISAFTANRRGMGAVAALIRQHHPHAHITAGGPFVTALPVDTLKHYKDLDTVVIGEGEATFMELLDFLVSGRPVAGIPGTAWRNGDEIAVAPPRPRIDDLDRLASSFDYFTSYIVMTSRGCPSRCTFCGSFTMWGRKLRFQSVQGCIDMFRKALDRLLIPFLSIKDDTFTADRQRAMAICDAIIENRMNFLWSCDTRVDCLDDELLRKMRLAGCQMVSFGVESGSPEILKSIRKETTPEKVLEATRIAQKYGMHVRYYMILLNRGESFETIRQSVDLIKAGRPTTFIFCPMAYYPGTDDWQILSEKQGLKPDIFFRNDFLELSAVTHRQTESQELYLKTVCDIGTIDGFNYTVEEREAITDRLPQAPIVHVELANAYFLAGRLSDAWTALNRAEELGFPMSNLLNNQRACIALSRGEADSALVFLEQSLQMYPNPIVKGNMEKLKAWITDPTTNRDKPPVLNSSVLALDFRAEKFPSDSITPL